MNSLTVIKTGGKQYLIKEGDIFWIEKIPGKTGKKVLFKDVLLTFNPTKNKTSIGQPCLRGVNVEAEIIVQGKGKKVRVIKYKPKTRYHKKAGHRQLYTRVKIIKIKISH